MVVVEKGAHRELLSGSGAENDTLGQHLDASDAWIIGFWSGCPVCDPLRNDSVIQRVHVKAFAPFMRDSAGRFEQHKTSPRIAGHDPPAERTVSEC